MHPMLSEGHFLLHWSIAAGAACLSLGEQQPWPICPFAQTQDVSNKPPQLHLVRFDQFHL